MSNTATATTATTTVRADSLTKGDVLSDGRRVTAPWRQYKNDAYGWGSVAIEGKRVKMFCADSVEVRERATVERTNLCTGTLFWKRGTTTYSTDGCWFVAPGGDMFDLHRARTPWGTGTLVATLGSESEARRTAERLAAAR